MRQDSIEFGWSRAATRERRAARTANCDRIGAATIALAPANAVIDEAFAGFETIDRASTADATTNTNGGSRLMTKSLVANLAAPARSSRPPTRAACRASPEHRRCVDCWQLGTSSFARSGLNPTTRDRAPDDRHAAPVHAGTRWISPLHVTRLGDAKTALARFVPTP